MKHALAGTAWVLVVGLAACSTGSTTTTSGGPGPTPDGGGCGITECFRAVTCRKADCSGPVTSTGCCPCAAGSIDDLMCAAEGGSDSGAQKADCKPACSGTDICLKPGACMFDANCVPASAVTCPDSGLCSTSDCVGELKGAVLQCICR